MECPDAKCRDNVTRSSFFIKIVGGALSILALAVLTISLAVMAAESKQNEKIAEIEIVKKDVEHIKEEQKEMKETQERMELKQQTIINNQLHPDTLKRIVEEAVRNGNSQ